MPLDPFLAKAMLDWALGGATPTRPTAPLWLSLATATPTTQSTFDGTQSPFRASCPMAAAASPQCSASNSSQLPVIRNAAAQTPVAFNIWDASSGGNRLLWGTLSAAVTGSSGQTQQFPVSNLVVTLT